MLDGVTPSHDRPFSGVADARLRPGVRGYEVVHVCLRVLTATVVAATVAVGDASGPSALPVGVNPT
jgi:hypothetical protein